MDSVQYVYIKGRVQAVDQNGYLAVTLHEGSIYAYHISPQRNQLSLMDLEVGQENYRNASNKNVLVRKSGRDAVVYARKKQGHTIYKITIQNMLYTEESQHISDKLFNFEKYYQMILHPNNNSLILLDMFELKIMERSYTHDFMFSSPFNFYDSRIFVEGTKQPEIYSIWLGSMSDGAVYEKNSLFLRVIEEKTFANNYEVQLELEIPLDQNQSSLYYISKAGQKDGLIGLTLNTPVSTFQMMFIDEDGTTLGINNQGDFLFESFSEWDNYAIMRANNRFCQVSYSLNPSDITFNFNQASCADFQDHIDKFEEAVFHDGTIYPIFQNYEDQKVSIYDQNFNFLQSYQQISDFTSNHERYVPLFQQNYDQFPFWIIPFFVCLLVFFVCCCYHSIKRRRQSASQPQQNIVSINRTREQIKSVELDEKTLQKCEISTCTICLMNKCDAFLPCQHFFHEKCIREWMKKKPSCPLCNSEYTLGQVAKVSKVKM